VVCGVVLVDWVVVTATELVDDDVLGNGVVVIATIVGSGTVFVPQNSTTTFSQTRSFCDSDVLVITNARVY